MAKSIFALLLVCALLAVLAMTTTTAGVRAQDSADFSVHADSEADLAPVYTPEILAAADQPEELLSEEFFAMSMAEAESEAEVDTKCTTAGLNVRRGPSTSNGVIRVLSQGARVSVYETRSGWSRIGTNEWVSSTYLGSCGGGGGGSTPAPTPSGNPGFKYDNARACTSGPAPGATRLMSYLLRTFGGRSGGIYNCRSVRGGTNLSLHGEGRALDVMLNSNNAGENAIGDRIVQFFLANGASKARELGVQEVIWRRKIWSANYPQSGMRAYSGTNPHTDHVHIGLNRWGAANLRI